MNDNVYHLVQGLIKSSTMQPLSRSKPFMDLFLLWKQNIKLSTWTLRMKTVVLLAFAAMLRPLDVAPRSVVYYGDRVSNMIFDRSQIKFLEKVW